MDYGGGIGLGIVRQQALTEGQESGAPAGRNTILEFAVKGFGLTEGRGGRGKADAQTMGHPPSMSGMLSRRNKKRPRAPNRHRRTSNFHIFRTHTARTLQVLSTRAWDRKRYRANGFR
jgi:hypothetical protein